LLLAAPAAHASPLLDQVGPIGGNAGFQGVVSGPGAASTYFNPALLTDAEDELLLAFAVVSEQVGITLDGRNGGEVPLSVGNRNIVVGNSPIPNDVVPTQWLNKGCTPGSGSGQCPVPAFTARPRQSDGSSGKTRTYLAFGIVKSLVKDRFTFGLYAMIPLTNLTTAQSFYPDEREALFSNSLHPELYGDRLTAISIVPGAAFKILPSLSLGVGLSIGLANVAQSSTYIRDSTDYSTLLLNNGVTTKVNIAPTIGVSYAPVPWLKFGGTIHSPEKFSLDASIEATLPSGTQSTTTRTNVFDWMPWSVGIGAQAEVVHHGDYSMALVGSVDYALWSAYQDRQGDNPNVYGSDLAWKDTLSGAFGVRQTYKDLRTFVDVRYVPSPVPEQIGRSNFVDNDTVGATLGADIKLKLGSTVIRPGIQLFANRLIYRHNTKDNSRILDELPDNATFAGTTNAVPGAQGLQTNNPGWPGFASAGWITGGAVTLSCPL
jgi:long-chain fatty acid transport protein